MTLIFCAIIAALVLQNVRKCCVVLLDNYSTVFSSKKCNSYSSGKGWSLTESVDRSQLLQVHIKVHPLISVMGLYIVGLFVSIVSLYTGHLLLNIIGTYEGFPWSLSQTHMNAYIFVSILCTYAGPSISPTFQAHVQGHLLVLSTGIH